MPTSFASWSSTRASMLTCDENHDDVRRMVISRGMVNKMASVHRDSRGMQYSQFPPDHGVYATPSRTRTYTIREVDRFSDQ